jgi:hypothetical protein
LIERQGGAYRFSHDRVQEAAYSTIPAEARAEVHRLIGRLLAVRTPPEKREEAIFEIVSHLNRAASVKCANPTRLIAHLLESLTTNPIVCGIARKEKLLPHEDALFSADGTDFQTSLDGTALLNRNPRARPLFPHPSTSSG